MCKDIDVESLKKIALEASSRAWCPYSSFPVGAALLMTDGSIIAGCNVENVSYGVSNCAERSAIFSAVSQGYTKGDFKAILIYMPGENLYSPCGACRQVLAEFFSPDAPVYGTCDSSDLKRWTVKELLPDCFNF